MSSSRARRWGAGKATAVRLLYETREPLTQIELAAQVGVSQPAVSQYLASLRASGNAVFENPGWLPVLERLPTTYHSCYSSRFTEQSLWYRIDDVSAQVADLVERDPRLIVSGDVGADRVRPWRVPSVAVLYGAIDADEMDELGFVPADSEAAASVVVRPVPDDRFRSQARDLDDMVIAPRLHLVADLLDLGGDDRADAAARFADRRESTST
ncbi:MAG: helix-turn-helix domain-containing protein [Ilumatobacteraceae bacterium]